MSLHKIDNALEHVLVIIIGLIFPDVAIAKIVAAAIWRMKSMIVIMIVGVSIFICSMFTAIFFPNAGQVAGDFIAGTPVEVFGYFEPGFVNSGTPQLTPLGDMDNFVVTAYFNDPSYYYFYHRWHKAIDIVPSSSYYKENQAFKLTNEVIIFATCSGMARSLQDSSKANYIYIVCDDEKHAVLIVHNQRNFLALGSEAKVIAGQPIGVMGNTGNSNGAHVHYAVKDLKTGQYIDPLYIY